MKIQGSLKTMDPTHRINTDGIMKVLHIFAKILQLSERTKSETHVLIFSHIIEVLSGIYVRTSDIYTWSLGWILIVVLLTIYIYCSNRTLSLNKRLLYTLIFKRKTFRGMDCFHWFLLFCISFLLNLLFLLPYVLLFGFWELIRMFLSNNLLMPFLFKKIFVYFRTFFLTPLLQKMFFLIQIIHGLFVAYLVYLFIWYHSIGGLAHELYPNNGKVSQYRAQTLDAIPKCSTPEYLNITSSNSSESKCSAIPGEYVTFTCYIDAFIVDKLIWRKNNKRIKSNGKYVISINKTTEQSTGSFVYSSTLVINDIGKSDFNLYSCIAVSLSELRFDYKRFNLIEYTLNGVSVRTLPGYFINLENIYPLTFNDSIVNTTLYVNDSRGISTEVVSPFEYCLPSIKIYHELNEKEISQVPNAKFCTNLSNANYTLRIYFKSGRTLVHPTFIIIEPAIKNDISCIHTEMSKDERFLSFFIYISLFVLFIIELLWYVFTWEFLLKVVKSIRKRSVDKKKDLFLFFCEKETDDLEFAIEILQPNLERDDYKILSCDSVNPGQSIFEMYITEIRKCKKVLVIISDNFLNDKECKYFLRFVLPSLFQDQVLDKNDIITVWNKCQPKQFNVYEVLNNALEVTIEGTSDAELERVTDIIEKSMNEDISHNILFRCMFKIICLMHGLYTVIYPYRFKTLNFLCSLYITYYVMNPVMNPVPPFVELFVISTTFVSQN